MSKLLPTRVKIIQVSKSKVELLLSKYPSLTPLSNFYSPVQYNATHPIFTMGPPTCALPRRLHPGKLKIMKAEFSHMLELVIIQPSSSQWAAPLHMVPKKDLED